ncbi:MAG: CARDB domain-containing protein, partial [Candidatus Rokuibacteriota bacterium]
FHLSTNGTLGPGDIPLGSRSVGPLNPGVSEPGSTSVAIPIGTAPGSYYIIAKADGENLLVEATETNNTKTRLIKIGPDLKVSALSAPSSAAAGATIAVTDTVKNLGGGSAGPSTVRFFLSTDAILDAGDAVLGSRGVPGLVPGAASSGPTTVTIPPGTPAGPYFVLGVADADHIVSETSESNNAKTRAITVAP